jgi:hypothetical protein
VSRATSVDWLVSGSCGGDGPAGGFGPGPAGSHPVAVAVDVHPRERNRSLLDTGLALPVGPVAWPGVVGWPGPMVGGLSRGIRSRISTSHPVTRLRRSRDEKFLSFNGFEVVEGGGDVVCECADPVTEPIVLRKRVAFFGERILFGVEFAASAVEFFGSALKLDAYLISVGGDR